MARFGAFRSAAIATLALLSVQQAVLRAQEKQAPKSTPAVVATTSRLPVSYTHLDVYKRQIEDRAWASYAVMK